MFTQVITPKKNPVVLYVPEEMLGHEIRLIGTSTDSKKDDPEERKRSWEKYLAFLKTIEGDMSDFTFNREEANERFH